MSANYQRNGKSPLLSAITFCYHDDVIKLKHFPRYWRYVGNSPATGEFPSQRPVTRSFDVFFDLCLNKQLSKQSRGWWFETPSRSSGRHCNDIHRTSHDSESARITISKLLKPGLFMDIRGQPVAWGSWVDIAGWFLAIEADYIWVFDIYHSKLWSDCHW